MNLIEFIKTRGLTKYLIFGFLILVTILVLQKLFLLVLLIAISLTISYFIGMFQMAKSIGVELVTFATILTGFVFGPTAGVMIGVFLIIAHLTVGHFAAGPYVFWVVPSYILVGFLSGILTGFNFTTLGIYIVIGLNAFNIILTTILSPSNLGNYIPFSITNVVFNLILFYQFGPLVSLVK